MLKKIIAILKLGISCVLVFFLASCSTPHVTTPPVATSVYEVPAPSDFARGGAYHSIAPGETLWRISKMYDVDVDTLKKVNRIRNVRKLEIGQKLYIPGAAPRKDVVTLYPSRKWKYIIIHHSATDAGNSMQFNKTHLRRGWKGVGYHFIIDNGTMGKDDGQIETGPRWIKQQDGAHCKASQMNEKGIGICLVGNFSKGRPSKRQLKSLAYLVNQLREYYKIPKSHIIGHGNVKGASTECPGKRFPWKYFWSYLGR